MILIMLQSFVAKVHHFADDTNLTLINQLNKLNPLMHNVPKWSNTF